MALHILIPERATLHGQFSREIKPTFIIDSGDTVRYSTLDVSWGMEQHGAPGTPRQKFEPREAPRDDGPALCGPVAIRGAEPGMTLEIHIEKLRPASWGWTYVGNSPFTTALHDALGIAGAEPFLLRWQINTTTGTATSERGQTIALRPFLGTIGMPPAQIGLHSGWTPRVTGGNMDCKECVEGSILYLPIAVSGGLVSIGDGHAVQGDGEVGGTAIECMMDCVELRYVLREDMPIRSPRVYTSVAWICLGFGETLEAATAMALNEMLDLLVDMYEIQTSEALALSSLIVDLRITQIVNGTVGVHAVLPHAKIK